MGPQILAQLNLARDHFRNNRLTEAEGELGTILSQEPSNPHALTLLAGIQFRRQRLTEADELANQVLLGHPRHLDALALLAVVRKAQSRFDSAAELFQKLISAGNESADLYTQLGTCRMETGDFVSAGIAFKKAIELDRGNATSYYNLGMALKKAGTNFETFVTFKRAIQLDPNRYDSFVQIWESMRKLLNWEEGVEIMEQGLRMHPHSPLMEVMLAVTYGKVGRKEEAEKLFKEAASDPASILPYAHWLQEEGRFEESLPVLIEAIRLNPVQGQAYYNLAMAKHFDFEGQNFTDLLPVLLKNGLLDTEQLMFLYYALAKSYEQQKNFEIAMRNYDLANKEAYNLYISNDREGYEATEQDALEQIYTREKIERVAPIGSKSETPIFIVGMIRTGTTLLDQILSSHHSINSAGEQPFWQISAGRVNNKWLEKETTAAELRELEKDYLAALHAAAGEARRITDKMPTNFWHIGMMTIAFPNARFIHTRRNPMDTILSIYTTFLGRGTQFAYDQANIVDYYKAYLRTMDFWRSVIPPDRMLEIDYEELVSNKEDVIRQVLDFCGLDWDPACLEHDRSSSHVSTPSLFTARQPVNTASVDRWKRYESWLGKLLELRGAKHPAKLN
jgi:tetratricopeptide (TPR) repeat protein